MKTLTLEIPDAQNTMPEVVQVQSKKKRAEEILAQLTPAQRETWEDIKGAFEEFKLVREGKKKARPIRVTKSFYRYFKAYYLKSGLSVPLRPHKHRASRSLFVLGRQAGRLQFDKS